MRWDGNGRVRWTPKIFFAWTDETSRRTLINKYLLRATPWAFPSFDAYYEFGEHLGGLFNVPPQCVIIRGSCQIGFSITPKTEKVWQSVGDESDLDVALVDVELYDNTERRLRRWERLGRMGEVQGMTSDQARLRQERFEDRQQDRFYHCCRLHGLPAHLTGNYKDAVAIISRAAYTGIVRPVKIFVFRDWWALRSRYESDLRQLNERVQQGQLVQPEDDPLPRLKMKSGRPPVQRQPRGRR